MSPRAGPGVAVSRDRGPGFCVAPLFCVYRFVFQFFSTAVCPRGAALRGGARGDGKPMKKIQCHAVDQLARGSMKNAASCETACELQDT